MGCGIMGCGIVGCGIMGHGIVGRGIMGLGIMGHAPNMTNEVEWTHQLFFYILNIQKMCHQNQSSGFFKVWTFFRCFDRDLRELKQNNKLDTDKLFYYI